VVILGHRSFSLQDLNCDSLLVILIGSKDLAFLGWDKRSTGNNCTHNSSDCFYSQAEGSGINDNQSFSFLAFFSTDNTSLNCCSVCNSFIRVDTSVWFFSIEKVFNELSYFRNSCRSSNQNDFINLIFL